MATYEKSQAWSWTVALGAAVEAFGPLKMMEYVKLLIATGVDEQPVTTNEIASNLAQTSAGIQGVNPNVSQRSSVASEITRDISEVNQSANEMFRSSSQGDSVPRPWAIWPRESRPYWVHLRWVADFARLMSR